MVENRGASDHRHGPGVRFPPPFLFAGGLMLAWLLHRGWPLPLPGVEGRGAARVAALLLGAAGIGWMAWGLITFRRARTAIIPHHPASRLVTEGPYRFGRNPMYLGMSALYAAVAIRLDTLWALALFPLVIVLLHRLVIRREERYLSAEFGEEYDRFRARVPRWIGPFG